MASPVASRVALITGCSTGIGLAAAVSFAKAGGWTTLATMRTPSDAPASLTSLPGVVVLPLDVTSDASIAAIVDHIKTTCGGRVDVLVNNAGYGVPGTIEAIPLDVSMGVFDVNVWGSVRAMRAVLPLMRARKAGVVIQVSSTSGARGIPTSDVYTGSKFAIEGILECTRYALAPEGVSVVIVSPGPVRTAFTDRYVVGAGEEKAGGEEDKTTTESSAAASAAGGGGDGVGEPAGLARDRRLTKRFVDILNERMQGADAQDADEVGAFIHRVAVERLASGPREGAFRVGTCAAAQRVLDNTRHHPDGLSGPVFAPMWAKLWEVSDALDREDAEAKGGGA